jgi:hypothetical protein
LHTLIHKPVTEGPERTGKDAVGDGGPPARDVAPAWRTTFENNPL